MPHYDGPYTVINIDKDHSTVTLNLPNSPNIFPVFHMLEVLPYSKSDISLFRSHCMEEPHQMATMNISLTKYLTHDGVVMVTNTLFVGLVMVPKMTSGSQALNFKIARCSIAGWHRRLDLLDLSRFFLQPCWQ